MALLKAHKLEEKERTKDIYVEENVDFAGMYLSDTVLEGLKSAGFVRPSPIQLAAIPLGRCGLDLIVQAKSGTGKTCVFTVIALEMVSVAASTTQVLVIAPTREIAVQGTQVICAISSHMPGLKASTFIGGLPLSQDIVNLQSCHIAVGTPGRITQLVELGYLKLDNIRLFVLDEADQLLTGQFTKGVVQIAASMPLNKQVVALSATYSEEVASVVEGLMRSPTHVRLGKDSPALIGVSQFVRLLPYHLNPHRRQQLKMKELVAILSAVTFNQCLVFSNSQLRAESICNSLRALGWPVSFLTGGQAQIDRLQALDSLCSYKCRVLVSTDLSARGIDSEHVNLVINMDIPRDHATYLHRVGRAGRFGSKGGAITLATKGDELLAIRAIATLANVRLLIVREGCCPDILSKSNDYFERLELMGEERLALWLEVNAKQNHNIKISKVKPLLVKDDGKEKALKISKNRKRSSNNQSVNGVSEGHHSKNKHKENECEDSKSDSQDSDDSVNVVDNKNNAQINGNDLSQKEEEQARKETVPIEKNVNKVINLFRKITVDSSKPEFAFDDILKQCLEKYDSLSVDDNPQVLMPKLPNTVIASREDLQAMKEHWRKLEDQLEKQNHERDQLWESVSVDIKTAVQAVTEGKDLLSQMKKLEQNGVKGEDDRNTVLSKSKAQSEESYLSSESSSGTSETDYSEEKKQLSDRKQNSSSIDNERRKSTGSKEQDTSRLLRSGRKKKYEQKSEDQFEDLHSRGKFKTASGNSKEKRAEKIAHCNKYSSASAEYDDHSYGTDYYSTMYRDYWTHRSNYNELQQPGYGYWNSSYGNYATNYNDRETFAQGEEPGPSAGSRVNANWNYNQTWSNGRTPENRGHYANSGQPGYTCDYYPYNSASSYYRSYIESAQKFASMMEYVHAMGRMSAWVAQDYQSRCNTSSQRTRSRQRHQYHQT